MKKIKLIIMLMLIPFLLLSCVKNDINTAPTNVSTNTPDDHGKKSSEAEVTINILDNGESMLDSYIGDFRKAHPGVKLNFIRKDRANTSIILDDLLSDNGADIINIEESQMGQFNFIDGFVNLLEPPYNAGTMLDKFQAHQLSWTQSLDGKKLLALPLVHSPRVTYYREDILAQYGFPTDPEKLAVFMENPDNWLNMAIELKKHDKWIIQWKSDPMDIYTYQMGYFDNNIDFIHNTPDYIKMLSAVRKVKADNLASFINIWEENGHEALRNDKIVMVYMGCWGENNLATWAPDTKGKWRATRLPFGIYRVDGTPALAISKNSKHKELAWELIKMIVEGDKKVSENSINNRSEFLGGQESKKLYAELRKKIPRTFCTPLDKKVEDLWIAETQRYYEFTSNQKTDDQELMDIEQKVKSTYGKDIEILKNAIKNKR